MTIKEVLAKLEPADRDGLMYAFENGIGQYVRINSQYVGVYITRESFPYLIPEITNGAWSIGSIDCENHRIGPQEASR